MVWLFNTVCCVLITASVLGAQDIAAKEVDYQMYSGIVSGLDKQTLTVTRTVAGKPPESRTFLLKPETKIEGKLKTKARVTVGYLSKDEGEVAMRVIVRGPAPLPPPPEPPKKK
jgi:hypothetical protein